jgi:ABC-type oligopeptide transport system substrate-binding subunit
MEKENWEKEFDERFSEASKKILNKKESATFLILLKILKSFIHQLLRQEREKLLNRIKLKKWEEDYSYITDPYERGNISMKAAGYNQAIADLEKLKNQLKNEK